MANMEDFSESETWEAR